MAPDSPYDPRVTSAQDARPLLWRSRDGHDACRAEGFQVDAWDVRTEVRVRVE